MITIPFQAVSDGISDHVPRFSSGYHLSSPDAVEVLLQKLGKLWMKEQGIAQSSRFRLEGKNLEH